MRVAVLLHWNEGEKSGVFKKVVSQIRVWRCEGVSVFIHVVSRRPLHEVWRQYLGQEVLVTFHVYNARNWLTRLRAWKEAVKTIMAQGADLVYHRYDLFMPGLRTLGRSVPLVLEINTNDLTEYCFKPGLRCLYNRFTRVLVLRAASGLVFVTHELAGMPHFARYKKPSTVVANGIDLNDYPVLPPPHNKDPRLVFIGTGGQPWHGVDKVIYLAQVMTQWHFDLIGVSPEGFGKIPPNVTFYPPLERKYYEALLAQADCAIGTLALHRKKMNEACPLKTREYLAYGLPVIIGYQDTDFPQDVPFILRLPNTENNVHDNIAVIKCFVAKWKGKRVSRDEIYHLDIRVKERQRLAFFSKLIEAGHS